MKTSYWLTFAIIGILMVPGCSAAEENTNQPEISSDFAFNCFRAIAANNADGNDAFSPYSAETALAMLGSGASGETEKEIAAALQNNGTWEQFAKTRRFDPTSDKPPVLTLSTSLWFQKESASTPFADLTAQLFGAQVGQVDFTDSSNTVKYINEQISRATGGKVPILFDSLPGTTRCVLASAVHFAADWKLPFDPDNTLPSPFTLKDGSEIKTNFMSQTDSFPYYEGKELSVIELPYKNGKYSMLILLPKTHDGLAKLEQELNSVKLAEWYAALRSTKVNLRLPKFTAESNLLLNDVLTTLGVRAAFSRDADFSKINGQRDLYLNEFRQRVFVKVDESGTEAAAATGAAMALKSASFDQKVFQADRPFLYLICRKSDAGKPGTILFLGRLVKPTAVEERPATPYVDPALSGEGGSFN